MLDLAVFAYPALASAVLSIGIMAVTDIAVLARQREVVTVRNAEKRVKAGKQAAVRVPALSPCSTC
jgi:hypothetical protein